MRNQVAAALITALLVVAIVAAIATTLISRLQIDIQRSEINFNADTAYLASEGVYAWAVVHYQDLIKNRNSTSAPIHWPIYMPTETLPGGKISGSLENAQGRFNINNLANPAYQPILARLINYVDGKISYKQGLMLARKVTSWLTPKDKNSTTDNAYQKMQPSYRSAHRSMLSPSELRLVDGFNAQLYYQLLPYLVALPQSTAIDVNASSEALLVAGGCTISGAAAVINYLKTNSDFQSLADFEKIAKFSADRSKDATQVFDTKSDYYFARANVTVGKVYFMAYYLLQYNKEHQRLDLIRYSQGTL
jgi:general secretion pathway protein K